MSGVTRRDACAGLAAPGRRPAGRSEMRRREFDVRMLPGCGAFGFGLRGVGLAPLRGEALGEAAQ